MSILGRALTSGDNSSLINNAVLDTSIVSGDVNKVVYWNDDNSQFELANSLTTLAKFQGEAWGILTAWYSSGLGSVGISGSFSYSMAAGQTLYWAIGSSSPTFTQPTGAYVRIGVSPAVNTLFIEKDYEDGINTIDFKGRYATTTALESAHPAASNVGSWAVITSVSSPDVLSGLYEGLAGGWTQRVRTSVLSTGAISATAGTNGTPSSSNKFVTNSDSRLGGVSGVLEGDLKIEVAGLLDLSTDHTHTLRLTVNQLEELITVGTLATVTSSSNGTTAHSHDVDLTFNMETGEFGATISVASVGGHAGSDHGLFIGGGSGGAGGTSFSAVVNSGDWSTSAESGYETFQEATISHNLSLSDPREFVAQFFDTDGWMVQLDVKAIDSNSFKIFSVVALNDLSVSVR